MGRIPSPPNPSPKFCADEKHEARRVAAPIRGLEFAWQAMDAAQTACTHGQVAHSREVVDLADAELADVEDPVGKRTALEELVLLGLFATPEYRVAPAIG